MILFSPFIRRRVSCDGDGGPTRTQQCRRGHRVVVIGQEQDMTSVRLILINTQGLRCD